MSSVPGKARIVILGVLVVAGFLVPAGSASAQTLNGLWEPFTRCPVDAPPLLATDGVSADPLCVAATSPNGEIKLGNTTAATGASNLQIAGVASAGVVSPIVQPETGALVAEPANVPGGLLGLMCPSDIPLVSELCATITEGELNRVTATVAMAGEPSDFSTTAGLQQGRPIVTLPVKVNLDHPLLAPDCAIGSEADPILLKPANITRPTGGSARADLDGTPNPTGLLTRIATAATQGDSTFAAPGAQNCGLFGLIDQAINLQQGLPSPSGNNYVILNGAQSFIMTSGVTPVTGQQFSDGWHSAVLP